MISIPKFDENTETELTLPKLLRTKDVLEIEISPSTIEAPVEQLTFAFYNDSTGVSLALKWDATLISIPIK